MAAYIALDWEKNRLTGLCATVGRDRVRVGQFFELAWPLDLDRVEDPAKAGQWLRGELERLEVSERRVLVSLPREEVVVRQLDVPDVPDAELPELVRLQAETKSASSLDQLILDFLPLPKASQTTGRQVLLVTVPSDKINQIRDIVATADLELVSVGVSPVGTAELVVRAERRRQLPVDATVLMVALHGKRLEISLLHQQRLLSTHAAQLQGDDIQRDARSALAEIRRFLGSLARMEWELSVSRAWIIGTESETGPLRELMQQQLACDVVTLDPLDDPGVLQERADAPADHAPLVGPVGMLLQAGDRAVDAVDFVSPRKPIVRPDRRRLYAVLAAAGVVLAAAVAYGGTRWQVYAIESRVNEIQNEIARLDEAVRKGKPTVEAAELVRSWNRQNVNWLAQMRTLAEILEDTSRIYLVNYHFAPPSDRASANVKADCFARGRRDVELLNRRLAERGFVVRANPIAETKKDSEYPFEFVLDVSFSAGPTKGGATAALPARASVAHTR